MKKKDLYLDYIKENPELFVTINNELMRLFFELSCYWTIDEIKDFSEMMKIQHSNKLYKDFTDIKNTLYDFFHIQIFAKESINELKELNNQLKETERNSRYEEYLSAIEEKYLFVHLKDLFPNIYDKIVELERKGKASFEHEHVNLKITQKEFAKIVKNNGYDIRFLIFLPKFMLRDNKINENSFRSEVSKQEMD